MALILTSINMANERKTESIIRSHFEKFTDLVEIEEQASDIPKIGKLLKNASKKGGGQGRPEFLITVKKNPNLLIVVECKADISKPWMEFCSMRRIFPKSLISWPSP